MPFACSLADACHRGYFLVGKAIEHEKIEDGLCGRGQCSYNRKQAGSIEPGDYFRLNSRRRYGIDVFDIFKLLLRTNVIEATVYQDGSDPCIKASNGSIVFVNILKHIIEPRV